MEWLFGGDSLAVDSSMFPRKGIGGKLATTVSTG